MNVKVLIITMALALCAPLFADDAQEATDEQKPKPTVEEVDSKVESLGEALGADIGERRCFQVSKPLRAT